MEYDNVKTVKRTLNSDRSEYKEDFDLSFFRKINKDRALILVNQYCNDLPLRLELLRTAISNSKFEQIIAVSHGLKGLLNYFNVPKYIEIVSNLEKYALCKNPVEIMKLYKKAEKIIIDLIDEFEEFKKSIAR
jgi:hypothetical protein